MWKAFERLVGWSIGNIYEVSAILESILCQEVSRKKIYLQRSVLLVVDPLLGERNGRERTTAARRNGQVGRTKAKSKFKSKLKK